MCTAGSSTAFHLARLGHRVTVLERERSERIKPCGGGMAASVQQWFPFDLKPAVDDVIQQVDFSWCLTDPVVAEFPGSAPFWIVKRERLDALLLEQAIALGADLRRPFEVADLEREENHWLVRSKEGEVIEAKAVVLADGSGSPWPTHFGIGPRTLHMAKTLSVRLEGMGTLQPGTARFEFGLVHHGFAWAFPLQNGINVGVGTFIGGQASDAEAVLEQLLPDLGFSSTDGLRQNADLRVWNGHTPLHGKRIVAVGDAASLCDPFLAEGLRPSLMSGCEAAASLDSWLNGTQPDLSNYTVRMRECWGDSMAWGLRIAQVCYRFTNVGYQLGIKRAAAHCSNSLW